MVGRACIDSAGDILSGNETSDPAFANVWHPRSPSGRRYCERVELMMHEKALMKRTQHLRDASADQVSRLSVPVIRQLVVLLVIVILTVTCAFWLRLAVLEDRAVGLSCRQGSSDWLCLVRNVATFSYEYALLGLFAVIIAAVNLARPSRVMFAFATVAATIGAILYNVGGAGIAITLLILSLARRERETV